MRVLTILILSVVGASLSGCSSSSFVGKRYDNFTAFYNTFYNARRSYRTAMDGLVRPDEAVDRTRYMDVFASTAGRGGGRDFEDAISKSADVLRDHPDSKWVDDALLLIGKSYFGQGNFVGAQQKFEEVIGLDSGLDDEARFWLARTLIASGFYGAAEESIIESLAVEDLDRRWGAMLRLALGELRVREERWEDAAEGLAVGLDAVRDRALGARAQFLLAQVLETIGRYDEAAEAYRKTRDFKPDYELSFAAQVSEHRVRIDHLDPEPALRAIRKMQRDDKHFQYAGQLVLLRGQALQALGLADDAYNMYFDLLYDKDNTAQLGDLRGPVHYSLAELYRDLDVDFVAAAAHFDTAAANIRLPTAAPGSTDEVRLAPEAIADAQDMKTAFGAFAGAIGDVNRMDSLLTLGRMDEEEFLAIIEEIRAVRVAEEAERQRLAAEREIEQAFQRSATDAAFSTTNRQQPGRPGMGGAGVAGSFLFHDDPVASAEGKVQFEEKWGARPLLPNWRRQEAIAGADISELEGDGNGDADGDGPDAISVEVDVSAVPRDSLSQLQMEAERALARYETGNVLFLGMSRPDSAAVWYRMVVDENPDEPVARRAFYALAEVQGALGDSVAARGLYEEILRTDAESEFAERVRSVLGLPPAAAAAPDSSMLAISAYDSAFSVWQAGAYGEAFDEMFMVAGNHPTQEVLPMAFLAAGSIYLEWAAEDSLDLFGPLPISVPDSVLANTGFVAPPEPEVVAVDDAGDASVVDATGDATVNATGDAVLNATGDAVLNATGDAVLNATGDAVLNATGDAVLNATGDAVLNATGDALLNATGDAVLNAIGDAVLNATGDAVLNATGDAVLDAAGDAAVSVETEANVAENLPVQADSVSAALDPAEPSAPSDADSLVGADSTGAVTLPEDTSDAVDTSLLAAGTGSDNAVDGLMADSTAIAVTDSTLVIPEEVAEPVDPNAWRTVDLEALLQHIVSNFGGSAYSSSAQELLNALIEIKPEPEPDTLALALHRADSLAALSADSLAAVLASDSLGTAIPADSLAAAVAAASADSLATVEGGLDAGLQGGRPAPVVIDRRRAAEDSLIAALRAGALAAAVDSSALGSAVDSTATGQIPDKTRPAVIPPEPGLEVVLTVVEREGLMDLQQQPVFGWFLVIAETESLPAAIKAMTDRSELREHGELEVLVEPADAMYLIVLGRFSAREAVDVAVSEMGSSLPDGAWILRID